MKKKIIKLLVLLAVILVGLLPLGVNPYEQMRSSPVGRESNPSCNSCQHNSRISNIHGTKPKSNAVNIIGVMVYV